MDRATVWKQCQTIIKLSNGTGSLRSARLTIRNVRRPAGRTSVWQSVRVFERDSQPRIVTDRYGVHTSTCQVRIREETNCLLMQLLL